MLHRRTILIPLFIGVLVTLMNSCVNSPRSLYGEAGFKEAFFDKTTLQTILADPGCVKVRFYNVRRTANDTQGSAMAIAVQADGKEIQNGTNMLYQLSDRITGNTVTMTKLLRTQARQACLWVRDANEKSYCTEFTKAQIETMLNTQKCNGIRIVAERRTVNDYWSMRIRPITINAGTALNLAAPPSQFCTDPCPAVCGPAENYVNS